MKKCKNCGINNAIKYSKYTTGEFCSSKCARSFSTKEKRKEINIAVSKKLLGRIGISRFYSEEKWQEIKEKRNSIYKEKLLNADFNTLGEDTIRKRILIEQNNACNKCKLSEWLGKKIILELEHIDGNHYNNERNNLEMLCPNCHSLTPTWRGRNKRNNLNRNKINDEQLLKALLINNFNMRQALISVGLAAKGGNYGRCHRLKREYEEIL
jgi:Zn finger protein HypA/HybF involved in hydrogenase expression